MPKVITHRIFGFGSLINTSSLMKTAPRASDIRPAYVKGFRREFNLMDTISGWSGGKLAGIPYCALDAREDNEAGARVNGVLFTVGEADLANLIRREHDYKLVETTVYDFETDEPLGQCALFSACKNNGSYDSASPSQREYLRLCLQGARQYGDVFCQVFLDTTFIGDKKLSELPELIR